MWGFTLLELIVSSVLIALILVATYSAFSSGLKIWTRANKTVLKNEQVFITLERLARELRSNITFSSYSSNWSTDSISFPILSQPLSADGQPAGYYLPARVTYSFNDGAGVITRQLQIYGRDDKPSDRQLATGIKSLKFYYRSYDETGQGKWEEKNPSVKPTAVRVEIIPKGAKDEPEETISRIIGLP